MDDRNDRIAELSGRFPEIEWVEGPAAVEICGLALPGSPTPPDPLVDVLTAATGGVELAEEIPGWPERESPADTSSGSS